MGAIASKGQLRMSFLRWAVFTVPLILLLGFLSGSAVPMGGDSGWYRALTKPAATPPGWVFPLAWTILYVLLGLSLALVLNARGARGRGAAIALFVLQFALNLAWAPIFFGAHQVTAALLVNIGMIGIAVLTTFVFGRIRSIAAWLLVPYMVWISFAAVLTWRIGELNPGAATLAPNAHTSQML